MTVAHLAARVVTTESERDHIFRLRYNVYVKEMGKPYPATEARFARLSDPLDDKATLIALVDDTGAIVGSLRCNYADEVIANAEPLAVRLGIHLLDPALWPNVTICSRLIVAPDYRKRGTMWLLSRAVYRWALEREIDLNLIHTSNQLIPLFERLGFRHFGARFVDQNAGSAQQPLYLLVYDTTHLQAIESPFLQELQARHGRCVPRAHAVHRFQTILAETPQPRADALAAL